MAKFNSVKLTPNSYYIYLFLYLTLITGFLLNEDSTGGAFIDYTSQKNISQDFSNNFLTTLLNYDQYGSRHSPLLIFLLGVLEYLNISDAFIRLIYLHLCLFIPWLFYLCLTEKFKSIKIKNWIFIIISSLIFLSPTFRSLSIWPDSRIFGLLFFLICIYFYLRFENTKKIKFCYLNIIFYTLSSYLSPNFAIFSIYFFYNYLKFFKLKNINIYIIVLLNLFLSFPAFYYIFYLDINFLNKSAILNSSNSNIFFSNYFNQILIIPTIFFFYFLPFMITKIIKINKINLIQVISSIIILSFSIAYFDYSYSFTGGGIFFKFSNFFLGNNIFFFIIALISLVIIINVLTSNFNNFLLIILILLSNPQISIYHKYYDPFLLIMFFSLFNLNTNLGEILNKNKYIFIYLYFTLFLVLNLIKTLWII